MEENRLQNTSNKLSRLNVNNEIHNNSIILRGTSLSKSKLFLTIFLPIILSGLTLFVLAFFIFSAEIEIIIFPKIIVLLLMILLTLLYYGIKNLIKLRKSKKNQVNIMPGKIVLKNRNNEEMVFQAEDLIEMLINIEENASNAIGEIYIIDNDFQSHLLLRFIDNNLKYLNDDLNYISNTFLTIFNFNNKTE